jgi:hypothetical protein
MQRIFMKENTQLSFPHSCVPSWVGMDSSVVAQVDCHVSGATCVVEQQNVAFHHFFNAVEQLRAAFE